MSEPIRRVPVEIDAQGQVKAQSVTSPIRFGVRAGVGVPPSKIIPIVFVPGIMGSNLKTKASKGKPSEIAWRPPNGSVEGKPGQGMGKAQPKAQTGAPRPGQHRD
jgi:hypothetical protein